MENAPFTPRANYLQRQAQYTEALQKLTSLANTISYLRIIVFLSGFGLSIFFSFTEAYKASIILFSGTLLLFIFLVLFHEELRGKEKRTLFLLQINEASLERLSGNWTKFKDDGAEFIDSEHQYSIDLDIFGQGSLFQWLNTAGTYLGRLSFKNFLTRPLSDATGICQRQAAMMELANKLDFRQRFQAETMFLFEKKHDPKWLLNWAEEERMVRNPFTRIWLILLPCISVAALILTFSIPGIPYLVPALPILTQAVIIKHTRKKHQRIFDNARGYKNAIKTYEALLKMIEVEEFQAHYLRELQARLANANGRWASTQIKGLSKVTELMDFRYDSLFYPLLNLLILWDYHCIYALDRWKAKSGASVRSWLTTIGEIESLASFAIIHHDYPDWAVPAISEEKYHIAATELGHPLLSNQLRVNNDLTMQGAGSILLITGSNMSGKSTLLRTVGINLILAYNGAPVCAKKLTCSIMEIYTSMRVNDNLEKNISSFYAELLRIKVIVEAAKKAIPLFFLLDEIFRGTNTRDRHIGARTVLKNLSKAGTMGLVSTHDLELGELEQEKNLAVKNYHFTEYYEGDKIRFDYKLHRGVSTTTNAIYLMKMVGIDNIE